MKTLIVAAAAILLSIGTTTQAAIPQPERDALIALYDSTDGPHWIAAARDGWLGAPGTECSWSNVRCDATGSTVVTVEIVNGGLSGPIPPQLANLTNLQILSLALNGLTGQIPAELGSLQKLRVLELSGTELTGSIPPELTDLTNLEFLYIRWNRLTGTIPPELGNLTTLRYLDLSGNNLTGTIPPALGRLSSLEELNLSRNDLTGAIPPAVGDLQRLRYLVLDSNRLSGPIPSELARLGNLTELSLSDNNLDGSIPSALGSLSQLHRLALNLNRLTGPIPLELCQLSNLDQLRISNNLLTGELSPCLGNLTRLEVLQLGQNRLTGPIPSSLGNLWNLQSLALSDNQLIGPIPPSLGNLKRLQTLELRNNMLSGAIPPQLGGLSELYWLYAGFNQLSGEIPSELGDLSGLDQLDLQSNELTGEIPAHLGDLRSLRSLYLGSNRLVGELPSGLEKNTLDRGQLDLSYNALSASDLAVKSWADGAQPGWHRTQTLPPTNVLAQSAGPSSVALAWQPILYSGNSGRYEVWADTGRGSILVGHTPDKRASRISIDGLPDGARSFRVRTVTDPHAANRNEVASELSSAAEAQPAPSVSISDLSITEGNAGLKLMQFAVSLSRESLATVTVHYSITASSASAGSDYVEQSISSVAFAPGEMWTAIVVEVVGDLVDETDESFQVTLTSAIGATIGDATATGLIVDDDTNRLSIADEAVVEGHDGRITLRLTVKLSGPSASDVSVTCSTDSVDGPTGATPGVDFVPIPPRTVAFASGSTSLSIDLTILGDRLPEPDETLIVRLSSPQNAELDDLSATVTILDDDSKGVPDPTIEARGCSVIGGPCVLSAQSLSGASMTTWSYSWTLDDAPLGTGPSVTPVFEAAGPHWVRLTVTNSLGSGTATRMLTPTSPGDCPAGELCILGGRFRVSLEARDQRTGNTGTGHASRENDLFGHFALPSLTGDPDNPEVFVKILDGRGENGHFWTFFGGLTDLEYTLTVRDTEDGTSKSYTKAAYSSSGGFDVGQGATMELCTAATPGTPGTSTLLTPCVSDPGALCLHASRFRAELTAHDDRTARTEPGVAIPSNDFFGYFALPAFTGSTENPEVFMKLIDGRIVNGSFWVFAGGMTDLEYTLTVTDTITGQTKTYDKPFGSTCALIDVSAF